MRGCVDAGSESWEGLLIDIVACFQCYLHEECALCTLSSQFWVLRGN